MREPPLTIQGDVGRTSGPIRHAGDVRILGCVLPGAVVEAGGDLFVARDVRGAVLSCDGNLIVNGVVSGEDTVLDVVETATLRHVADARVLAGGDVEVRVAAERARITAGGRIRITGEPGVVRGGSLRAGAGVEAVRVDSSAGQPARIEVGNPPFDAERAGLAERRRMLRARIEAARDREECDAREYRRRVSEEASLRRLFAALEHRRAQLEAAGAPDGPAWLIVTAPGPVRAVLRMRDREDVLADRDERWTGEMALLHDGDSIREVSPKGVGSVG